MLNADVRQTLDRLIRDRGENYGAISRLLGRNAAYVQQFIKRGIPRKLDEADRRTLASHFLVDETLLGGDVHEAHPHASVSTTSLTVLPPLQGSDQVPFSFDREWLRSLTRSPLASLAFMNVPGDAMQPTLIAGDHVIIDRADDARHLRDGIYAIGNSETAFIRRVAINAEVGRAVLGCDNTAYPSWTGCRVEELNVIGRVVWTGHRIG